MGAVSQVMSGLKRREQVKFCITPEAVKIPTIANLRDELETIPLGLRHSLFGSYHCDSNDVAGS